ncbi:MAG: hypothetical protein E7329_09630 [Clostridiales bacterium]|nr:hypothetical protein [Clostridiales bacterium]
MQDRKWVGKWICASECPMDEAPLMHRTAYIPEIRPNARIFISGVGFYVLYINGRRVGDELLQPAFSAYDQTVYYNVYDAAPYLQMGENQIEVLLGNGWFNEQYPNSWGYENVKWKSVPQLIFEMEMDGENILWSDGRWKWSPSQVTYNSLRSGETCDRTRTIGPMQPVTIAHGPGGCLKRQMIPPIRLREEIRPVQVMKGPGGSVYDFGVNLSGNAEICVSGKPGEKVTLQYSERIFPNGELDLESNAQFVHGPRFQKDEYVLAGDGKETWHSELGYNGFRYVEVSGNIQVHSVIGRCFHTDIQAAGEIACDYAPVLDIHRAVRRSTLTNFHHIPTDCPHREKNGWTGDAHLSCEQALFNFDMKAVYLKWLDDIVDSQRPNGAIACIVPPGVFGYNWGTGATWDYALFEIPWQLYRFTKDTEVLRRYIVPMERYLSFLEAMGENDIFRDGLGDWCPPKEAVICPTGMLVTAYAAACFEGYGKAAAVLGDTEKAAQAEKRAEQIRRALIETWPEEEAKGQTALALYLFFHLSKNPERITQRLVDEIAQDGGHLLCGILGTRMIFDVLTENGHFDTAWKIAMAEGYPGYRNMLSRSGGTLGERWDGSYSLNHHMFSPIGAWFYRALGGIEITEAGFEKVRIHPHMPEEIGFFSAWHASPLGKIQVSWNRERVDILLPGDCRGLVCLRDGETEIQGAASFLRSQFA